MFTAPFTNNKKLGGTQETEAGGLRVWGFILRHFRKEDRTVREGGRDGGKEGGKMRGRGGGREGGKMGGRMGRREGEWEGGRMGGREAMVTPETQWREDKVGCTAPTSWNTTTEYVMKTACMHLCCFVKNYTSEYITSIPSKMPSRQYTGISCFWTISNSLFFLDVLNRLSTINILIL